MNKTEKFAKNIALSAIAYARMALVVFSLIAISEGEWIGVALFCVGFGVTTTFLNRVIDMPSDESINNLAEVLGQLKEGEEDGKD